MKSLKLLNRKLFSLLPMHQKNQYCCDKVERVVLDKFGAAVNPITKQKEEIQRITLQNDKQMSVQIITRGATITTLKVPDASGCVEDIVLGFDDVPGYLTKNNPYFGAICGRVCNRVANGCFQLNGREIKVSKNNGKHSLHGGFIGFDKVHWEVLDTSDCGISMKHCSPDGHEGYPGEVTATVHFTLTDDNCLKVLMEAKTTEVTAVNLTNHSYFNLAGHAAGSKAIYEHLIRINADKVTERDEEGIPTGCLTPVEGSAFDFRALQNLGDRIKEINSATGYDGYDDNYCVNVANKGLNFIARVIHPKTGRWLEVFCDQPGVHFYSGVYLEMGGPIIGKCGTKYVKHGAFCLETQKYPDAVNHDNFPSIILCPDAKYSHEVVYKFGVCGTD